MCGIVGYIGDRDIESILIVGLERLSYRGYDSAGISTIYNQEIGVWKAPGKLRDLKELLKPLSVKGHIGIGHTRWATHGEPNQINAHPHLSGDKKLSIVHNGIVENFSILKDALIKKGVIFQSETDTEVIAHLIEDCYTDSLLGAVEQACLLLEGSYGLAVISEKEPDTMVVCRKGSPLIIGIGNQENFVGSDINALLPHTKQIVYLEDNELGIVTQTDVTFKTLGGDYIDKEVETIDWDPDMSEKNGYDHFMLKEIYEQPHVLRNIIGKYLDSQSNIIFKHHHISTQDIGNITRFIIQACGTSWHAGLVGKYYFEGLARLLTDVDISSEFRYRHKVSGMNEVVVALSQSGETADTLACLHEAKSQFFKILSFVNVKNSSIARESNSVIYTHAGQEVGVASTKNYVAQLMCLYLFGLFLARVKDTIPEEEVVSMIQELKCVPDYIDRILDQANAIKKIAKHYCKSQNFIFIGRGVNYPSALEGALKLKEISYIHATGYPAGELKHGPIALIDEKVPVVCIAPKSETYSKIVSNIEEVRARKGKTIVIATEGDTEIEKVADHIIYIPEVSENLSPILVAVPLQLLAYYIALELGCDVDQPRNLAKSVTVE